MRGRADSLNLAVSAGLTIYEALRADFQKAASGRPRP
jgi:tRNA G18 (ribose-2'-O)-methylase SpoU